jgi:hypothetical protein
MLTYADVCWRMLTYANARYRLPFQDSCEYLFKARLTSFLKLFFKKKDSVNCPFKALQIKRIKRACILIYTLHVTSCGTRCLQVASFVLTFFTLPFYPLFPLFFFSSPACRASWLASMRSLIELTYADADVCWRMLMHADVEPLWGHHDARKASAHFRSFSFFFPLFFLFSACCASWSLWGHDARWCSQGLRSFRVCIKALLRHVLRLIKMQSCRNRALIVP